LISTGLLFFFPRLFCPTCDRCSPLCGVLFCRLCFFSVHIPKTHDCSLLSVYGSHYLYFIPDLVGLFGRPSKSLAFPRIFPRVIVSFLFRRSICSPFNPIRCPGIWCRGDPLIERSPDSRLPLLPLFVSQHLLGVLRSSVCIAASATSGSLVIQ